MNEVGRTRGGTGALVRQQFSTNRILKHKGWVEEETGHAMQFTLGDLFVLVTGKINLHYKNANYYFMKVTKEHKSELLITAVHS